MASPLSRRLGAMSGSKEIISFEAPGLSPPPPSTGRDKNCRTGRLIACRHRLGQSLVEAHYGIEARSGQRRNGSELQPLPFGSTDDTPWAFEPDWSERPVSAPSCRCSRRREAASVAPTPAINPSRSGRLGRVEDSFDFAACWVRGRVLKTSFRRMDVHCERLYRVSSSAQDGQDKVGVERLDRVITAHLAHDVARPAQLVPQEDLHLAAHRAHLLLGHAQVEVLLRSRPGLAVLVGEREPRCVAAVGAAAVQERSLEDADGTGRHGELEAALGVGARLAAGDRLALRLDPL